MKSRREKIEALLNSPIEGERAAARAAMGRMQPPKAGSPEWIAARAEWNGKIEWAMARLGSPLLSPMEQRTIRNIYRYRGDPWSRGAHVFAGILRKLETADNHGKAVTSPSENGIIIPQELR